MDAYPPELIAHEKPLLLVSGLGIPEKSDGGGDSDSDSDGDSYSYPQLENGTVVAGTVPAVATPAGDLLLQHFLRADAVGGVWAGRGPKPPAWRIRAVGRDYTLPPRKALPPVPPSRGEDDDEDDDDDDDEGGQGQRGGRGHGSHADMRPLALHSPVSPLSPLSPLYPDGVVAPLWLRKHQVLLPAVFVAAHELYTASNDTLLQNRYDNELIAAINTQKKHFAPNAGGSLAASIGATAAGDDVRSSGHRSRFVLVLLAEKSILASPRIEERLSYLKRSTNLTPGLTFFFLPAHSSSVEVSAFVATLLAALVPAALDYYQDLSKHARRKRNKGTIPPPTVPSSRALPPQAWTLRYEFKLAVFAEFRQELDVAARGYETAYEKLLSDVFETTTSWSPRWAEARLLADAISLRIIRCYLWSGQYTAAKRRWDQHAAAMGSVLDRKGRGTHTYGFAAWQSRWNRCLAELLGTTGLTLFTPRADGTSLIFAPPSSEKNPTAAAAAATTTTTTTSSSAATDGLPPTDLLHHPGFYYLRAAEHTSERHARSKRISLSDPDNTHDAYLCPPPSSEATSTDHSTLQLSLLQLARREFAARAQRRMVDGITYSIAKLHMQSAAWGPALKELRGVAAVYRREGWWLVLEEVLWRVVECGRNSGDGGSVVVAVLELLCRSVFSERKGWVYDLTRCLDGAEAVRVRPTMVVRGEDVVCCLTATYAFAVPKVHVGDAIISQLVITSSAHPSSAPLIFNELKINYEGAHKAILLTHTPTNSTSPPLSSSSKIDLTALLHTPPHTPVLSPTSPQKSTLHAPADLTLRPGETKIFELSTTPREAGDIRAVYATFVLTCPAFELDFMLPLDAAPPSGSSSVHALPERSGEASVAAGGTGVWWTGAGAGLRRRPLRGDTGRVEVLPRPPKMELTAQCGDGVVGQVYVDETVRVEFRAVNGEEEAAVVDVGVRILGWPLDEPPPITWYTPTGPAPPTPSLYPLGTLHPGADSDHPFTFTFPSPPTPADCAIEITAYYHLLSDPDTPISKVVVAEMPVVAPFQTGFDFSPRVWPGRWPGCFDVPDVVEGEEEEEERKGGGITQRWCLTVDIKGAGTSAVVLDSWELPVLGVTGGVVATVIDGEGGRDGNEKVLCQDDTLHLPFTLDVQKLTLEDRRSASVDVNLVLHWHRQPSSPSITTTSITTTNTTTLPVPRLPIPASEPRVLASILPPHAEKETPGVVRIQYMLENPTNYFLTFSVSMDAAESFAFSGAKQTVLQVLPVSRVGLEYRVFAYAAGAVGVGGAGAAQKKKVKIVEGGKGEGEEGQNGRWVRPVLRVVDRYFNKTLRVSPGGEGVEVDKTGLIVWVPTGEE